MLYPMKTCATEASLIRQVAITPHCDSPCATFSPHLACLTRPATSRSVEASPPLLQILHDSMLLTIFSASNYGGVCRNRGGVLVFDEKGPAEVKEFYAPTLEQIRDMYDTRMVQKLMPKVDTWRNLSRLGTNNRATRQKKREENENTRSRWVYLLEDVNEFGASLLLRSMGQPRIGLFLLCTCFSVFYFSPLPLSPHPYSTLSSLLRHFPLSTAQTPPCLLIPLPLPPSSLSRSIYA